MRIIGGRFGRRVLKSPEGAGVRPTTDRVREALFNLLAARLSFSGAHVLDLFAGSGALGLEALSRGAAACTFVEQSPKVLRLARENAAALGVEAACRFVRADALRYLRRPPATRFDLAFADPPYALDALPDLPALVRPFLAGEGLFVLEHDARHAFADDPSCVLARAYGRTVLSIFESAPDPPGA